MGEARLPLTTLSEFPKPPLTLLSTNSIERMFSLVRHSERNIKRTRGSHMLQRWLGTVLLACERRFRRVNGYAAIAPVMARIEAEQTEPQPASTKKAA
jgi:putative transposase